MRISVCDERAYLSSLQDCHRIDLTSDWDRLIPEGYDIVETHVELPPEVDAVRLIMGGFIVATFRKDHIHELKTFPIYLSKVKYYHVSIQLVYNREFLMQHEEYCMVDEMKEQEEYGEYVEIFDGQEYHTGHIVTRVEVPTGHKIKEITKKVPVDLPNITFVVRMPEEADHDTYAEVPVRQLIWFDKGRQEDFEQRFHLEVVKENNHSIQGYVTNYIMYKQGLTGLKYAL